MKVFLVYLLIPLLLKYDREIYISIIKYCPYTLLDYYKQRKNMKICPIIIMYNNKQIANSLGAKLLYRI